jgi:hypothetical protein
MHPLVQENLKNLQMETDSEWVFPSPRRAGEHIKDFGKAFEKAVKMAGSSDQPLLPAAYLFHLDR